MALTKLSSECAINQKISLDNLFIVEYLPYAPDNYTKVYLYGLSLACNNLETDNNLERISKRLGLDEAVVLEAFQYWETQGLVNISYSTPISIEYKPVKASKEQYKKFKKEKYKEFNDQLHAMLPSRNILPNEYNEYYSIMEAMNIEKEAMLTIISYCIRLKGEEISYPYILAVARNLAQDGYTSYERVNEKLQEFNLYEKDLITVLSALKLKRSCDHDDKKLLLKWKSFGFTLDVILNVAKSVKKGGMTRLDSLLTKYYENHLFSEVEINDFNNSRDKLYELTRNINRIIGVYYEQLDFIIETYTTKWISMGFDGDCLMTIADYCFRHNTRTLEGMSSSVDKFYKQGLLSVDSIKSYLSQVLSTDKGISEILEMCGIHRSVTSRDREFYRNWTTAWNFSDDIINYSATLSLGKANPLGYMNSILAGWFEKKVTSLAQAKELNSTFPSGNSASTNSAQIARPVDNIVDSKNYTAQELNALFDNLNSEDI